MSIPRFKQFITKCDKEFSLCAEIGEKGCIHVEYHNLRYTLYQYTVYGEGKYGVITDSGVNFDEQDPKMSDTYNKKLLSTKEAKGKNTLFVAESDFHIIGFNCIDMNQDWDGKLVTESFVCDNDRSWMICFDGRPIVNEKELMMYDYAKLDQGKKYDIIINDGALGVFTKRSGTLVRINEHM